MSSRRLIPVVILLALLAPIIGCGETSQERINSLRAAVDHAVTVSQGLDAPIDELKAEIAAAGVQLMVSDEEVAEGIRAFIEKAQVRLDEALAHKQRVEDRIEQWRTKIDELSQRDDLNVGDEMEAIGEGIKQAGGVVPPPWGLIVSLIGAGVGAVGTAIGNHQRTQRKKTDAAFVEVVAGVEDLLTEQPDKAAAIKAKLKARQSMPTRMAVDDTKKRLGQ